ncbi:hypothetical protein D3C80_2181410 [compost metagenome]
MLVVDPLTGAMYKLPEEVSTDLGDPVAQNSEQKDLQLVLIDSLSSEVRARLVLVN